MLSPACSRQQQMRQRKRKATLKRRKKKQSSFDTLKLTCQRSMYLFSCTMQRLFFIYYFHKTAMFLGTWLQKCILKILQIPFFMASVKGKFHWVFFFHCTCFFCLSGFLFLLFFSFFLFFLDCSFLHDMQSCLYQEFDVQLRESLPRHSRDVLRLFVTCTVLEFNTS